MDMPSVPMDQEGRISHLHPRELAEAPENPREITDTRYADLKYALDKAPEMMEARPVIVDSRTGEVVCGNMRLRAAKELGWERVPVYFKKFESDAERREWMFRDNQDYGHYVPDEVAALVNMHDSSGADMRMLGFAEQELADLRSLGELDADMPPMGDGEDDNVPTVYGVVIDCADEDQQMVLLEEFQDRGLKTRALMV